MKKNRSLLCLLALLCALLLSACAASAADSETPDASPQADQTPPAVQETSEEPTLEDLLGEDYVSYLTETITIFSTHPKGKNLLRPMPHTMPDKYAPWKEQNDPSPATEGFGDPRAIL